VSFLIDTNIISEVRKGARCDADVSAWLAAVADEYLILRGCLETSTAA
jgi:hypothetical protein